MVLQRQDVNAIQEEYCSSAPFNAAIIDNFVEDQHIEKARIELLNHYGWRQKNWISENLHNDRPRAKTIDQVVLAINELICPMFPGCRLQSYWALMHREGDHGRFHSDHATATLTLWLTPDQFLLDQNSGGLIVSPVKRPDDMRAAEYLNAGVSERAIEGQPQDAFLRIPYKHNRAVLFDSRNFHRTDDCTFDTSTPNGYRLNLTFAFDRDEDYEKRLR